MGSILPQRLSTTGSWLIRRWERQAKSTILMGLGIMVGTLLSYPSVSYAQSTNLSESDLKAWLAQVDAAASRQDLKATLQFYSPTFKTTDGLDREKFGQALAKFWGRFSEVRYQTQLVSWKRDNNQIIAETQTTISGVEKRSDRKATLTATLTSRQMLVNQQLVGQEVLTEKVQLKSGNNPPKVDVKLPNRVNAGQEFSFDAIVTEPLNDTLVLGGAAEKTVDGKAYLDQDSTANLKLEVLTAGGLFKLGDAPKMPQDLWISSFFIREDGFTLTTDRVSIAKTTKK